MKRGRFNHYFSSCDQKWWYLHPPLCSLRHRTSVRRPRRTRRLSCQVADSGVAVHSYTRPKTNMEPKNNFWKRRNIYKPPMVANVWVPYYFSGVHHLRCYGGSIWRHDDQSSYILQHQDIIWTPRNLEFHRAGRTSQSCLARACQHTTCVRYITSVNCSDANIERTSVKVSNNNNNNNNNNINNNHSGPRISIYGLASTPDER